MRYPKNKEIIRIPVAIGIMIRNVTMTGMQFAALSYLLVYSFHINKNLAVLATFIVITAYTSISGLWSVCGNRRFSGHTSNNRAFSHYIFSAYVRQEE